MDYEKWHLLRKKLFKMLRMMKDKRWDESPDARFQKDKPCLCVHNSHRSFCKKSSAETTLIARDARQQSQRNKRNCIFNLDLTGITSNLSITYGAASTKIQTVKYVNDDFLHVMGNLNKVYVTRARGNSTDYRIRKFANDGVSQYNKN